MELNSPLLFPHVSERCFDSVFRRCCVIRMKSCFVDHRTHKEQVTDAMKEGIFVREYDLADFLRSGPGALAGLIAQHGFEAKNSRDECVDLIAHYVERGGDGGTTWNTMRASCGLPPKRPPWEAPLRRRKSRPGATAAEAVAVPAGAAPADAPMVSADDPRLHGVVGMAIARRVAAPATQVKVEQAGTQAPGSIKAEEGAVGHGVPAITPEFTQSALLMSIHIARTADRDFFSISAFKLAAWPGLPSNRAFRQSLVSSMLASGLLMKAEGRSTSAADAYYFPRLETGAAFDSLVSREFRDSRVSEGVTLRENLDVERFADWFNAPGRSSNASVLSSTLRANVPKRRKGRADLTTAPGDGDEFAERADRILQAESSFRRLLQVLTPAGAPPPLKRRRGESPSPHPANARMSQDVRYTANLGGGRVWARSVGAQGLPRRAACELLHRTVDLDIVACVFVLVHQMVRRLALRHAAAFTDEMAVLGLLATRRDALIAEELKCDLASGKALLIAVLGGQTIPARWQGNAFLARVRSAGRMLRWLACSCVPDVYSRAASDEAKWAMGSTFAIWWQIVEDRMLAAWVAHIASTRVLCDHLSLHHDGVRVDAAAVASMGGGSIEAFCEASALAIERETGFMVAIVEKKHRSFLELLRERSAGRAPAPASTPLLLRNGNCIPLALSRHRDAIGAAATPVWSDAFLNAEVAMSSGLRRYKECFTKARLSCDQHLGFDPRGSGAYLLHCEHRGRPHCVAVRVDEAVQQATVFDAELAWEVPVAELRSMVSGAVDARVIVSFRVWDSTGRAPAPHYSVEDRVREGLRGLVELEAGSSSAVDSLPSRARSEHRQRLRHGTSVAEVRRPLPRERTTHFHTEQPADASSAADSVASVCPASADSADESDIPDEATTSVRLQLLRALELEVVQYAVDTSARAAGDASVEDGVPCELCPFYRVRSWSAMRRHLDEDHTADVHFSAAGRKMLSVVYALFDRGQMRGGSGDGRFLARAAEELRRTVRPTLSARVLELDRALVLVLTAEGPCYRSADAVAGSSGLRRVGHTYYDGAFASMLLQEIVLSHGRVRTMLPRLTARLLMSGPALVELLPRGVPQWLGLIEDVMSTSYVATLRQRCLSVCHGLGEFDHLSVDATLRILRRVKGQADYLCSASARAAAPVGDDEAVRRLLTVMGRTSTPVAVVPVRQESAADVAAALATALSAEQLSSVRSMSVDHPTPVLFQALRGTCPNLQILALDPTHLAMVYEHCHYRKRTRGSRALRILLAKFWRVDPAADAAAWGPAYDGSGMPPLLDDLDSLHCEQILNGDMDLTRAARVLDHINPDAPWRTLSDWIEALAAHSAVHRAEIVRRSHQSGAPLCRLIYNVAEPKKAQWLFNNLRLLHALPPHARSLVASGTTANEAFHAEINSWARNTGDVYRETVELQLSVAVLGKMLAHTNALTHPTLRQLRASDVLARQVALLRIDEASWTAHCAVGERGSLSLAPARLPLKKARDQLRLRLWGQKRGSPSAAILKRPAGLYMPVTLRPRGVLRKRTAFSRSRLGSLVPPALRRRRLRVRLLGKTPRDDARWFPRPRRVVRQTFNPSADVAY